MRGYRSEGGGLPSNPTNRSTLSAVNATQSDVQSLRLAFSRLTSALSFAAVMWSNTRWANSSMACSLVHTSGGTCQKPVGRAAVCVLSFLLGWLVLVMTPVSQVDVSCRDLR
jgi:hypothetical protein